MFQRRRRRPTGDRGALKTEYALILTLVATEAVILVGHAGAGVSALLPAGL